MKFRLVNRTTRIVATLLCLLAALAPTLGASTGQAISKTEFEVIEGIFHDGLGTFAEISLANELIALAGLKQPSFDRSRSVAKMRDAISRLPASHPGRAIFEREIASIRSATKDGAAHLLNSVKPSQLTRVRHTALEFTDARAGDLRLEFEGLPDLPV